MTGELAVRAPELFPPGTGPAPPPAPGAAAPGPVAEERPPAFTPESFKAALQGAAVFFAMLQGLPPEVLEQMLPDRAYDRLALRGVPLANKYELKATEWLQFWNRWRDEILFAFDVSAVAINCAREYRKWKIEPPKAEDAMETRTGAEPAL